MKRTYKTMIVGLLACLFASAACATTTLPTVVVNGTSIDGYRLVCTGLACADFLASMGGITPLHLGQIGMGEGGGGGDLSITKAQFCSALRSQQPSDCNAGDPPSVPTYDPGWEPNGCGTGPMMNFFLSRVVDLLYQGHYSGNLDAPYRANDGRQVSFLSACNNHDRCWGGGGSRLGCDNAFHTSMLGQCSSLSGSELNSCQGVAAAYFSAVASDAATPHYNESVQEATCAAWAYDMSRNKCS